jgi:LL-diaminopimelate aminotransferase
MKNLAKRLEHIQEYYFSRKLKEVKALVDAGKPIINMGIGSPDLPPHPEVIAALQETASNPKAHGYQAYQGIPALRQAFSDFYQRHYQVALLPDREILPLLGSKEGIMHISMAFLDEGDQVLIPDPGYPTYAAVTKILGAEPISYQLNSKNGWYPDFKEIEKLPLSKVKLMWVNYPHMPTGARANKKVFEEIIAFGIANDIVIINDNPYSFVLEDHPKSIFQIPDAKSIALELNSLSKSSNLAGWRLGMVGGKEEWITAITKVKSNMDSGMFLGLQNGAIHALKLEESWYKGLNAIYSTRKKLMCSLIEKLGLTYEKDSAGLFVWAKLPEGEDTDNFVDKLLYEHHIFVTPGHIFGSSGSGYVRFSLCVTEELIREAIDRV